MKTPLITLLLITGLNLAHAEEAVSPAALTPEQARATWQDMTPEQQAVAKAMARSQAEEKQAAWGTLTTEEKAAKQAEAKEKLQPYRASMQIRKQERMADRSFGRR